MTDITSGWIQLHGSCYYDFTAPSLEHVSMEAIAHSLAYQCRFNGAVRRWYSVAEHSVWVMRAVDQRSRMPDMFADYKEPPIGVSRDMLRAALLHDASEAIIPDLPAPLRKLPVCAELNDEIARVEALIQERWPGDYDHPAIRQADLALLHTEKVQLLHPEPRPWPDMPAPLDIRLECWGPEEAKARFLHECRRLGIE